MTAYHVEMIKSPGLADAEVGRRLSQVYTLLIELGRKANSDASGAVSEAEPDASESGDVESTATSRLLRERGSVKGQEALL